MVVVPPSRFGGPVVVPIEHRYERPYDAGGDGDVGQVQEKQAGAAFHLNHVFLCRCSPSVFASGATCAMAGRGIRVCGQCSQRATMVGRDVYYRIGRLGWSTVILRSVGCPPCPAHCVVTVPYIDALPSRRRVHHT